MATSDRHYRQLDMVVVLDLKLRLLPSALMYTGQSWADIPVTFFVCHFVCHFIGTRGDSMVAVDVSDGSRQVAKK